MKTLFVGKIITMSEPLYAEAVIVDNGIISSVGTKKELIDGFDGDIVRFDGVMIPSFIDTHSHFTMTASQASQCDLRGCASFSEVKARIRSYVNGSSVEKGEWVIANNFDHMAFDHPFEPTLSDIDSISPDNPLILKHSSAHMVFVNSLALTLAGFTSADAEASPNNIILKDGRFTGWLKEGAMSRVTKLIPPVSVDRIFAYYGKTEETYAKNGITTVQDGYIGDRDLQLYRMLNEQGGIDIDLVAYIGGSNNYRRIFDEFNSFNKLDSLRIGGIKALLDGSPQLRTAWVRTPYVTENTCYHQHVKDEALINAFNTAAINKTQILVHCNGDAAVEQFLRCLEIAERYYPTLKELRPVIIHAQLMGRDQIPRAKELGAVISFFVAHCYHWGDTHLKNLGKERGMLISPVSTAEKCGVPYTFHQDTPVVMCDMLETIWCAVNRITRNGVRLAEDERVSVLDALRAVTVNAAYQYSQEDIKGTIEAGKYADIVILDKDILSVDPMYINNIKVLKTYKKGKCIFDAK